LFGLRHLPLGPHWREPHRPCHPIEQQNRKPTLVFERIVQRTEFGNHRLADRAVSAGNARRNRPVTRRREGQTGANALDRREQP
jgi:hypothetical protein